MYFAGRLGYVVAQAGASGEGGPGAREAQDVRRCGGAGWGEQE